MNADCINAAGATDAPEGTGATEETEVPEVSDEERKARLEKTRVKCVHLKAVKQDLKGGRLERWVSKIGGIPYLPLEVEYPHVANNPKQPLAMLCQINFGEIAEVDPTALPDHYPRSGILVWFVDGTDVYGLSFQDPNINQTGFRILYFPTVIKDESKLWTREAIEAKLKAAAEPVESLPFSHDIDDNYRIQFTPATQVMTIDDFRYDTVVGRTDGDYDHSAPTYSQIGGYPSFTQDDPRSNENYADYELLIQLAHDEPIMWGDCGIGNLFIQPTKLKQLDFSTVLYNWDCC